MPSEVVWDKEMPSDMTVHDALLQQLGLGEDEYLYDHKTKSASMLIADNLIALFLTYHYPWNPKSNSNQVVDGDTSR
jgi:hypothetical protein